MALISSTQTFTVDPVDSDETSFAPHFLQEAERCGLKVLPEWIRVPTKYVHEKARFGYTEFHHLWSHPQRPDAVIVFPDIVVRGVITAALELGAHLGNKTTFCFHRNAHVDILCPFPAMWTIFDEAMMADALIDIVRLQHAGKPISPVLLPPGFEVSKRTVPVPAPIFKGRSRSQY